MCNHSFQPNAKVRPASKGGMEVCRSVEAVALSLQQGLVTNTNNDSRSQQWWALINELDVHLVQYVSQMFLLRELAPGDLLSISYGK